jgi:hypothetical protein
MRKKRGSFKFSEKEIAAYSDSKYRNVYFRGIENGIWVEYTFEKINENWKLIRLEDYST